jgi:hypothetical protein
MGLFAEGREDATDDTDAASLALVIVSGPLSSPSSSSSFFCDAFRTSVANDGSGVSSFFCAAFRTSVANNGSGVSS